MTEIYYLSATETLKNIRNKVFSCTEVMQAYLKRIDEINPVINSYQQTLTAEKALELAELADKALAAGKETGPLHGLPISIKDAFFVDGFITSCGSLGMRDYFKNKSMPEATLVSRLRDKGAIVMGMTNVPEMLICPESDNLIYGQTKNPYDFSRTCGGSSGGEAATIAAGCSALGIGSDGGGSIRVPAHFSGIAALKPSQHLIPNTGNGFGLEMGILSQFVVAGPMARFVSDLIISLPILAGPDGIDPFTRPAPLKNPQEINLKDIRVAYYTDDGLRTPTADIQETVQNAALSLRDQVAYVRADSPACLQDTWELVWEAGFLGGDEGIGHLEFQKMLGNPSTSKLFQQFLELAKKCKLSVTELRMQLAKMDGFRVQMLAFFKDYDVIICPVVATCAKFHGQALNEIKDLTYVMSYNLSGNPSVVVRCGTSKEGLPIGVQVVAKRWHDGVALAVAERLETIFGGWKASPLLP